MKNARRFCAAALLSLPFFAAAQAVDTVPPQLKCKPTAYVDAGTSICQSSILAANLVASATDDVSPASSIALGVRKKCTGEGFPTGKTWLTFTVSEIGITEVELWAKDLAGNTAMCSCRVTVNDNSGNCDPSILVEADSPKDEAPIGGASAAVKRYPCEGDSTLTTMPLPYNRFGSFGVPGDLLIVTPSKTGNPLNGVSAYDLVLISKHILGLDTLSPYQLIAADANRDGKVTTYDIVLLRQLILGIIPELPGGASWRFLPKNYDFPDPLNPFSPPFPESIEVPRSADPATNKFWFFGVKIGDVNYSAELK